MYWKLRCCLSSIMCWCVIDTFFITVPNPVVVLKVCTVSAFISKMKLGCYLSATLAKNLDWAGWILKIKEKLQLLFSGSIYIGCEIKKNQHFCCCGHSLCYKLTSAEGLFQTSIDILCIGYKYLIETNTWPQQRDQKFGELS